MGCHQPVPCVPRQASVVSTCNGLLGAWLAEEPGAFTEHDSPWHGHDGYMTSEEIYLKLQGLLADEAVGIRYAGPELSETTVSRALGALQLAENNCVVFRRADARNQPKGAARIKVRLYKLVSNPDAVEPVSTQHLTGRVRTGVSRAWNAPNLTSPDSDDGDDEPSQAGAETEHHAQAKQPTQPKPGSGARKSGAQKTTSEVFSEAWLEIHAAIAEAFQHEQLCSLEELVQAFADAKLPSLNVPAAKWQHVLQTAAHDTVAGALGWLWDEVRPKRAGQKRTADRDAARHSPQLPPAKTARHQIDWLPAVILKLGAAAAFLLASMPSAWLHALGRSCTSLHGATQIWRRWTRPTASSRRPSPAACSTCLVRTGRQTPSLLS